MEKLKEKTIRLLRKSDKYTNIDMRYLVSGGFWVLMGQIIISISAFVTTLVLTRALSEEAFGEYRFILSVVPIIAVFTIPKMSAAITNAVARGIPINLVAAVKNKAKHGLLASVLSIFAALYYFVDGNNAIGVSFLIVSVFIPFFDNFLIYKSFLQGKKDFRTPAIYQSITRIISAAAIVAVVFFTHNVQVILTVFFMSLIIPQLFFFLKVKKVAKGNKYNNIDTHLYGRRLSYIGILQSLSMNMDKLLVWHFLGAETLAIYIVVITIPLELTRLLESFAHIALPKFSELDWTIRNTVRKLIKKISLLSIPLIVLCLLYIHSLPIVFHIIFPKYEEYILLAQYSSIFILLIPMNNILLQAFVAAKWSFGMLFVSIVGLITIIVIFFIFYQQYGLLSAILSLALKEIVILTTYLSWMICKNPQK